MHNYTYISCIYMYVTIIKALICSIKTEIMCVFFSANTEDLLLLRDTLASQTEELAELREVQEDIQDVQNQLQCKKSK